MLIFLVLGLAGVGAWMFSKGGNGTITPSPMTPQRTDILNNALTSIQDPAKLQSLSAAFTDQGLHPQAAALSDKAQQIQNAAPAPAPQNVSSIPTSDDSSGGSTSSTAAPAVARADAGISMLHHGTPTAQAIPATPVASIPIAAAPVLMHSVASVAPKPVAFVPSASPFTSYHPVIAPTAPKPYQMQIRKK